MVWVIIRADPRGYETGGIKTPVLFVSLTEWLKCTRLYWTLHQVHEGRPYQAVKTRCGSENTAYVGFWRAREDSGGQVSGHDAAPCICFRRAERSCRLRVPWRFETRSKPLIEVSSVSDSRIKLIRFPAVTPLTKRRCALMFCGKADQFLDASSSRDGLWATTRPGHRRGESCETFPLNKTAQYVVVTRFCTCFVCDGSVLGESSCCCGCCGCPFRTVNKRGGARAGQRGSRRLPKPTEAAWEMQ